MQLRQQQREAKIRAPQAKADKAECETAGARKLASPSFLAIMKKKSRLRANVLQMNSTIDGRR